MKTFMLCALLIGCASVPKTQTVVPHKSEYRLIVKAPASIIGAVDPKEFNFVIVAKSWGDQYNGFAESIPAYCILRGEELQCMITVHETNAKFRLEAMWLQPDPSSIPDAERAELIRRWNTDPAFREAEFRKHAPDHFCGKVRVGVTINRFGFVGGRPVAATWFDLEATKDLDVNKRELPCQYYVPREKFEAAREAIARNPTVINDTAGD